MGIYLVIDDALREDTELMNDRASYRGGAGGQNPRFMDEGASSIGLSIRIPQLTFNGSSVPHFMNDRARFIDE